MKKITLKVEGITCAGCVSKIRDSLNKNNDIAATEVSIDEKEVVVRSEVDLSGMSIKKSIEELGFSVLSIKKEA